MEIKVLGYFINAYLNLKEKVLDETLLNKLVFSKDVRNEIMEELGISKFSLGNAEVSLRKKGIIRNEAINPAIIPELDNGNLKLLIYFYKK